MYMYMHAHSCSRTLIYSYIFASYLSRHALIGQRNRLYSCLNVNTIHECNVRPCFMINLKSLLGRDFLSYSSIFRKTRLEW